MLYKELEQCRQQQLLLSIEREDVTSTELTGSIVFLNSDVLLMAQYTNEGAYDGLTLFPLDQITEVYWGNRFHNAISALVRKRRSHVDNFPGFYLESFMQGVIEMGQIYKHLAIYTESFSETGFDVGQIDEADNEWIKLRGLGTMASLSTISKLIKIENITRIEADSPYLDSIVTLHKQEKPHPIK